ncbi:MAG: hypothetical protein WDO73_04315 [Ignavibacteriota bacterium]
MEAGGGDLGIAPGMTARHKAIWQGALIGAAVGFLGTSFAWRHASAIFDPSMMTRWPWVGAAFGWAVFSLYWDHAAKNTADAVRTESGTSRGFHVFLTNVALLLAMAPVRGLGRFVPMTTPFGVAGLAVEAAGLALAIAARRHLGRNWSGEIAIKVDHRLVPLGPVCEAPAPDLHGAAGDVYRCGGDNGHLAGARRPGNGGDRLLAQDLPGGGQSELGIRGGIRAYCRESWVLVPGVF